MTSRQIKIGLPLIFPRVLNGQPIAYSNNKKLPVWETLRKEVVSHGFFIYKRNDTLHKDCESVIVGYIL